MLRQWCELARLEEMEFEVAAYAEPDQLFRGELPRGGALVGAEQHAVKRARLVAAAGRDRDRDVLQLQPHGCMQSDYRTATRLPVHDARPMRRHHNAAATCSALRSASGCAAAFDASRRRRTIERWSGVCWRGSR